MDLDHSKRRWVGAGVDIADEYARALHD